MDLFSFSSCHMILLTFIANIIKPTLLNRKLRDELSHNLFLMLQECNKFREHQAREILITTLEEQLECRREGLATLKKQIGEADDALAALNKFRENWLIYIFCDFECDGMRLDGGLLVEVCLRVRWDDAWTAIGIVEKDWRCQNIIRDVHNWYGFVRNWWIRVRPCL